MISKQKLKELETRIGELEGCVRELENMHARIVPARTEFSNRYFLARDLFEDYVYKGVEGNYCGRQLTAQEIALRPKHPRVEHVPQIAQTDKISNITLDELARLVIDGKSIVRKNTESVTHTTLYSPTHKTETIDTSLGSIIKTERVD